MPDTSNCTLLVFTDAFTVALLSKDRRAGGRAFHGLGNPGWGFRR